MSAAIVLSNQHNWAVKNWVFYQFFDDIRALEPTNQKLQGYLDQAEPILFDDFRNNPDDVWVAQICYFVAKQVVTGRLPTTCKSELLQAYITALLELVRLFEDNGRFVGSGS